MDENLESSVGALLNIDMSSLIAALIFGVIGYWMFRTGRRREHTPTWGIGLALMIYPYFVNGAFLNWAVGLALCGAAYFYWYR